MTAATGKSTFVPVVSVCVVSSVKKKGHAMMGDAIAMKYIITMNKCCFFALMRANLRNTNGKRRKNQAASP